MRKTLSSQAPEPTQKPSIGQPKRVAATSSDVPAFPLWCALSWRLNKSRRIRDRFRAVQLDRATNTGWNILEAPDGTLTVEKRVDGSIQQAAAGRAVEIQNAVGRWEAAVADYERQYDQAKQHNLEQRMELIAIETLKAKEGLAQAEAQLKAVSKPLQTPEPEVYTFAPGEPC